MGLQTIFYLPKNSAVHRFFIAAQLNLEQLLCGIAESIVPPVHRLIRCQACTHYAGGHDPVFKRLEQLAGYAKP